MTLHDAVVADGGGGVQLGAVVEGTGWEDGMFGDPLNPHFHVWRGDCRCALGMSGVWRNVGCVESSHPGAPMAKGGVRGLGSRGDDGEASGESVWIGGHADA